MPIRRGPAPNVLIKSRIIFRLFMQEPSAKEDPWKYRTGLRTYPKGYGMPATYGLPPSSLPGLYH